MLWLVLVFVVFLFGYPWVCVWLFGFMLFVVVCLVSCLSVVWVLYLLIMLVAFVLLVLLFWCFDNSVVTKGFCSIVLVF